MNPVNDVSASLMANMNKTKEKGDTTAVDAQDRFMTLLVTQMKNQDPLNPLDNAQVTSQLAQLSTVTGIDKVNATLQALQGSFQSNQAVQATGMIGHGVLVPGSTVNMVDGKAVLGVELPEAADTVKVIIKDGSGKAIRTMELGKSEAGTVPVAWDGKDDSGVLAPNGKYTFSVSATANGEKLSGVSGLSFGEVGSVSTGTQGVKLNLLGLNPVDFSEVKQIL